MSLMTVEGRRPTPAPEPTPATPSEQPQAVHHGSTPQAQSSGEELGIDFFNFVIKGARYAITPGVDLLACKLGQMRRQWRSREQEDQSTQNLSDHPRTDS
jgi:hypothetical protein